MNNGNSLTLPDLSFCKIEETVNLPLFSYSRLSRSKQIKEREYKNDPLLEMEENTKLYNLNGDRVEIPRDEYTIRLSNEEAVKYADSYALSINDKIDEAVKFYDEHIAPEDMELYSRFFNIHRMGSGLPNEDIVTRLETCISGIRQGVYGERIVKSALLEGVSSSTILCGLNLKDQNGDTAENDIIVIHPSGIYTIEVKNYGSNGTYDIIIDENGTWGKADKGETKAKYDLGSDDENKRDPIQQSIAHCNVLANILRSNDITAPIRALVVMANDVVRVTDRRADRSVPVLNINQVASVIERNPAISGYNDDVINRIVNMLTQNYRIPSPKKNALIDIARITEENLKNREIHILKAVEIFKERRGVIEEYLHTEERIEQWRRKFNSSITGTATMPMVINNKNFITNITGEWITTVLLTAILVYYAVCKSVSFNTTILVTVIYFISLLLALISIAIAVPQVTYAIFYTQVINSPLEKADMANIANPNLAPDSIKKKYLDSAKDNFESAKCAGKGTAIVICVLVAVLIAYLFVYWLRHY